MDFFSVLRFVPLLPVARLDCLPWPGAPWVTVILASTWSQLHDAFALLRQLAGTKLDVHCVNALIDNRATIEEIQQRFQENIVG